MQDVPPVLLSSLICARAIFDRFSGFASLIDLMQVVNSRQYPWRSGALVFFCELTNGHGDCDLKVRMVDPAQDEKVLFEQSGKVNFKDVMQVVTFALNMQGIVFPHPGEYRFQLFAGNHILGERRLVCRQVGTENPNTGES